MDPHHGHTFYRPTTMAVTEEFGFHNRGHHIAFKIRSLLISLIDEPLNYDKIASKIEYWIEYVLCERFTTIDELVEGVSCVAWESVNPYANVARFLKEFFDAPHRSEQARSFVDKLCEHVLRWFAIASVQDIGWDSGCVGGHGEGRLAGAASLVGHLVERGMLGPDLVRRHLVKPLIAHHHTDLRSTYVNRANAIYQLFVAAENTLLRGLLEPEDVQVCFEILDTHSLLGSIVRFDAAEFQVRCATNPDTPHHNLICLIRDFVRSIIHGESRMRGSGKGKGKEMPRRLKNMRGKTRMWRPRRACDTRRFRSSGPP